MSTELFDLALRSGRVTARRVGSQQAPLVLLIHGLSAHLHSFDYLVDQLAGQDLQLVALDLRGRGRSDITAPGSYGMQAHARDVLEIATLLGADQFDIVGWSMGALIGIVAANLAPQRVRRLVLIDHAGKMDASPVEKISLGLNRLDVVVDRPADYLDAIRLAGGIVPWSPFWDHFYSYELGPYQQGYKPTSDKAACLEDLHDLMKIDFQAQWKNLTMPTLLVRCQKPVGGGFIVPASERDLMQKIAPDLGVAEFDFDHYKIMESSAAANTIKEFLRT
ncbi:pimeloyl-ACP methyl ester carboxylesterase [Oxalobacteraceae bacterium GrIS 2.11]